jgi:hypothetical protein
VYTRCCQPADLVHFVASQVFLLMPFLSSDWSSWEQRLLATASRQHGPRLAAAAGWVQDSPGWVQDRVVQTMLPDAEPHAAESLRTALNHQGCLNNWHMAAHEFRWGQHMLINLVSAGCSCCWVCDRIMSPQRLIEVSAPAQASKSQSCSCAAGLYWCAPDMVKPEQEPCLTAVLCVARVCWPCAVPLIAQLIGV